MSKRPLQEPHDNKFAKKSKDDENIFLKPTGKLEVKNNNNNKKDYFSDEDDEDIYMLSQQIEENCNNFIDTTIKSFSQEFANKAAGTSTQMTQLTKVTTSVAVSNARIVPSEIIDLTSANSSSQKENKSKIPAQSYAEIRTKKLDEENQKLLRELNEMRDEKLKLTGENKNLRSSNKHHENKLSELKLKYEQEIQDIKTRNRNLTCELQFEKQESLRMSDRKVSTTKNVNFRQVPVTSSGLDLCISTCNFTKFTLNIPKDFFDIEVEDDDAFAEMKKEPAIEILDIQLRLAKIQSAVNETGHLSEKSHEMLFNEAANLIFCIEVDLHGEEENIRHIPMNENDAFIIECAAISVPLFRPKIIDENFSLTKSGKLFPEEKCPLSRRVLAVFGILSESKEFSQRLLNRNVRKNSSHTFISGLILILKRISKSSCFYDYSGLTMAAALLLKNVNIHSDEKSAVVLLELMKSILLCRCDNPWIMAQLTTFIKDFMSKTHKPEVLQFLCTGNSLHDKIREYKFFNLATYPEEACTLRYFLVLLITAYPYPEGLNGVEVDLLCKTTADLNIMAMRILEHDKESFKFLDKNPANGRNCGCYNYLIYAVLLLNQMALSKSSSSSLTLQKSSILNVVGTLDDLFRRTEELTEYPIANLIFSNHLEFLCIEIKKSKLYLRWLQAFRGEKPLKNLDIRPNLVTTGSIEEVEESQQEILDEIGNSMERLMCLDGPYKDENFC